MNHSKALFSIGQLLSTPGALAAVTEEASKRHIEEMHVISSLVLSHMTGDWGEVDDEDKELNNQSVKNGTRILSAYTLSTGVKVWIITEADRSVTTILLPEEY